MLIFIIHYKELKIVKNDLSSQYECGFIPSNDSRIQFEVQFYLISLSFIVFDVEIALILPYSSVIMENGFHGFHLIYYSLLMPGLGFLFEWKSGLLDLDNTQSVRGEIVKELT
jgi:NADH-quinone oxidoreductase subunit A